MFDQTQIADARVRNIHTGLKEKGKLNTSMTDLICQKVPASAIEGVAGKIKTLDFQAIAAASSMSGFGALDGPSEEMPTPMSDRVYEIGKVQRHKKYPRGLEKDKFFKKVKKSFIPHIDTQLVYEKDAELNTILMGNGTAATTSQDVTVRQLSATSNDQWSDSVNSDPLGDLRSGVQDSLADSIYLGTTKKNELQDHDQIHAETGWKKPTGSQLAEFLADYTGAARVITEDKVYQNGTFAAAADVKYLNAEAACVYNSLNILYLDWEAIQYLIELVHNTNVNKLHGMIHGAIVTVNPLFAIAFEDVA